jgi:hypothetical protein
VFWVIFDSISSAQHACDVSIQYGHVLVESDAGNGSRRVRPDPWEPLQDFRLGRNLSLELLLQDPRGPMKVTGATVVSESLPDLEDRLYRGLSQIGECRESLEEAFVVRHPGGYPGLLKEDLGNPDSIRVPGAAPGKGAVGFSVPRKQSFLEEASALHRNGANPIIIIYFKYKL